MRSERSMYCQSLTQALTFRARKLFSNLTYNAKLSENNLGDMYQKNIGCSQLVFYRGIAILCSWFNSWHGAFIFFSSYFSSTTGKENIC